MFKKFQFTHLLIRPKVVEKALRYALSTNEVGLLFFGNDNIIVAVERVQNRLRWKQNHFAWDLESYGEIMAKYRTRGFNLCIEGHSHSKATHLRRPSNEDILYFRKGPHIIVFPCEKSIRCWFLKSGNTDFSRSELPVRAGGRRR